MSYGNEQHPTPTREEAAEYAAYQEEMYWSYVNTEAQLFVTEAERMEVIFALECNIEDEDEMMTMHIADANIIRRIAEIVESDLVELTEEFVYTKFLSYKFTTEIF